MALVNPANAVVRHFLSDGTQVADIAGYVVKYEHAEPLYRMMDNFYADMTKRRIRASKRERSC